MMTCSSRLRAHSETDVGFTGRHCIRPDSNVVTIDLPTKIALIVFDGVREQRMSVSLAASTIEQSLASLYAPDGSIVAKPIEIVRDAGLIEPVILPQTGSYTLLIDPDADHTGTMELTINDVPPDISGTIVLGGPSVSVALPTPGQNARLSFDATVANG